MKDVGRMAVDAVIGRPYTPLPTGYQAGERLVALARSDDLATWLAELASDLDGLDRGPLDLGRLRLSGFCAGLRSLVFRIRAGEIPDAVSAGVMFDVLLTTMYGESDG